MAEEWIAGMPAGWNRAQTLLIHVHRIVVNRRARKKRDMPVHREIEKLVSVDKVENV
jgi:hypothetical protein